MKTTLALILSVIALVLAINVTMRKPETQQATRSSTYDRIMNDRTIRCAYQPWPPFVIKDPNTKKISGVFPDLFAQIGKDLNLKIVWTEEVGSANMFEGFTTGRYDMLCSPITSTPQRALASGFSPAIAYVPFYLYVREGDNRFDHAYDKANSEAVSMTTLDGDFTATVTNELFPKAKKVELPNMTNGADLLVSLAAGKADVVVNDPSIADVFIMSNPGKIRRVAGQPLRFPSLNFAFPLGEDRLRVLMSETITNYLDVGIVEKILNTYGLDETKLLRVATPYRAVVERKGEGQP